MTTATTEAATGREISYREAINEALRQEMARDDSVFVAGIDLAKSGDVFGITQGILTEFGPKRIMDTPISENAIAGLAIGAATQGLRPVISLMFIDFIGVCFDQILNQMAKMKYMFGGKVSLPLTVLVNAGAGTGMAAQHSQSLEALLCHIPGLKVVMPSTAYDAKGLMLSSMRDDNPVFMIMHKRCSRLRGPVPEEDFTVPLGSATVVREGADATIVATAYMVHEALAAAETLAGEGIDVEIVDPRSLQPLDTETIVASVRKTHRVLTVHEAVEFGGIGAEINAQIATQAFDYLDAPPLRLGGPFTPVPYSPVLEREWVVNADQIVEATRRLVHG
ncbi:MAG: alpha-ketoacid dehydrogenase subunit beta [Dehalococcoidia bacterium]